MVCPVAGTHHPVVGLTHSVAGVACPVAVTHHPVVGLTHSVAGVACPVAGAHHPATGGVNPVGAHSSVIVVIPVVGVKHSV